MDSVNHRTPILTYQIASGGPMGYAAVNERAVYLQGAPQAGFSLYGQMPGGSQGYSVNLAQVLLEFARAWSAPGDDSEASEARRQMQILGRRLGEALADQRARARSANGVLGRAADALEDVFRSLDAPFACRQTERELRYRLDPNPLQVAARVTGLEREAELAQYALNALCQSLVEALAPELRLTMSPLTHMMLHQLLKTDSSRDGAADGVYLNYGFDRLRLVSPVPVGSRVRAHFGVLDVRPDAKGRWIVKFSVKMECDQSDRPVLVAEWLSCWVPPNSL